MDKNDKTSKAFFIVLIVVFGLVGFFVGRQMSTKIEFNVSGDVEEDKTPIIDTNENKTTDEKTATEVPEEEEEDTTPTISSSVKVEKPKECKNPKELENILNFKGTSNVYCFLDYCTKDANGIINYIMANSGDTGSENVYTFSISKGKINVVKNGYSSSKFTISGIDNATAFDVHFSVQSGFLVYATDSKNNLYVYTLSDNLKKTTRKEFKYKDVKDFAVFEGHDYPKCAKTDNQGQSIWIAVHTTKNKFMIGENNSLKAY